MANYTLEKLEMIAQGGQAEIYDLEDDKVIRVARDTDGQTTINRQALFSTLIEHHIRIPYVYEYVEIDGRPAEVMQKISGESMLAFIEKHPSYIEKEVKKLAQMHVNILDIETECGLYSIKDIVHHYAKKPLAIDKRLVDFVLTLLEELPSASNICHGDFHPGNILMQNDEYYVIDWAGAYCGHYVSDLAHTYLLMKHVPEIPGQTQKEHEGTRSLGTRVAQVYLQEILKKKNIDMVEFSKWSVIMAFLRVCYDIPSEKSERLRYLENCYVLSKSNTGAALWYQNI